jgi:hypothetical protein
MSMSADGLFLWVGGRLRTAADVRRQAQAAGRAVGRDRVAAAARWRLSKA